MSGEESRDIYQLVVERNARLSALVSSIPLMLNGNAAVIYGVF
jgi:hypothetical protein